MEKIKAYLLKHSVSSNSQGAFSLQKKSNFGERVGDKIQYSLSEALYLVDAKKIIVFQGNKELNKKDLLKKFQRIDKKIELKYSVFKDLRKRGYILKTALKFGADFRVYEKGSGPGKSHAKWLVFSESESTKISLHEFSAKNRVAHSTRKKLLLAIVDEEGKITYYEISWIKP